MDFDGIKRNYDQKLWTKQMVKMCVPRKLITPEQYKLITGDEYVA